MQTVTKPATGDQRYSRRPWQAGKWLVATWLLLVSAGAVALEKEPFSEERFQVLQAENALILVDIYATWCPTCAQQQRVLQRYMETHPDVKLHVLEVDFDRDKQWVSEFRAPRQSTLILYRGIDQLWFSVAETREAMIFDAINTAASL